MTEEAFYRANELAKEINELQSLITTLNLSTEEKIYSLCTCRLREILSVAHLDKYMCEKFVAIVEEEIAKKESEFASL